MNYRKLGKTNLNISEIVLDTRQVGGNWVLRSINCSRID